MTNEILQIEKTNANDFKNQIVNEVTNALKGLAETLQNPDNNKLLSREETAKMLSISLVTLWSYTKNNTIPAFRIGNKVRYKKQDVLNSLQKMNKFSD